MEYQFLHLDVDDGKENDRDDSSTSGMCPYDFLRILEGVEPSERQSWCGSLSNETLAGIGPRQTVSSMLEIQFHSDDETEAAGFLLYWKAIGSCRDSVYSGTVGTITSVNYPR